MDEPCIAAIAIWVTGLARVVLDGDDLRNGLSSDLGIESIEQSTSAVMRVAGRLIPSAADLRETGHF